MAATHAAFGRRCFSFGDSHFGTCSISKLDSLPYALRQIRGAGKQSQNRHQTRKAADEGALIAIFPRFASLWMTDSQANLIGRKYI